MLKIAYPPDFDCRLLALPFDRYCVSLGRLRVSLLYSSDADGAQGLQSLTVALANQGLNPLSVASFNASTGNTAPALATLTALGIAPQAVLMIGAAASLAQFVRAAQHAWQVRIARDHVAVIAELVLLATQQDVVYMTVSLADPAVFAADLGNYTASVIATQVGFLSLSRLRLSPVGRAPCGRCEQYSCAAVLAGARPVLPDLHADVCHARRLRRGTVRSRSRATHGATLLVAIGLDRFRELH